MTPVSPSWPLRVERMLRRALLPMFALALLAAMWLALAYQLTGERDSARQQAAVASQALARVLSEHVSHILRQSDHATQLFKLKYEETGGRLRLPAFARRGGLLDSVLPARLDLPLALYDRDGALVDQLNSDAPLKVAQAPYFVQLASAVTDTALYSTPVLDRRTHKWQIQVARRLNDSAGRFAGAVVMLIDPLFFIDDYDRLNLGEQDALALTSPGAGLTMGRVGERLFIRDDLTFNRADADAGLRGEVMARPALDKVARVYGSSEMPRFALVAVVGVHDAHALAGYARHRDGYLGVASIASVLILVVVALLMKQSAELRASISEARQAQAVLRAAADGSLDAVLIYRVWRDESGQVADFIIVDINERGAAMFNRARPELLGQKAFALMPRFRQTGFFERYVQVFDSAIALEEEVLVQLQGDQPRWIHHQIVPLKDGVAVTSRNITARKQADLERRTAEAALRESEARLRTIADTIPAMVAYVDAREVYRFHNLPYDREFGRDGVEVPGRTIRAVVGEERYQFLQPYIARVLHGETLMFEETGLTDGRTEEVTYIPQFAAVGADTADVAGAPAADVAEAERGPVVGFHVMRHDITAKQREKQQLLRLAQIDPLTGLINRAGFVARLDAAMQGCRDGSQLMALMYMDIDRFKPVNDTHGHDVGDKLLKAFSSRLTHALRGSDTVARMGGDEFTIIMEGIGRPEYAAGAAAKIVAVMRAPFVLDGVSVSVSASIGLTYYRGGEMDGAALLKQADLLLYQAKQDGRDTWCTADDGSGSARAMISER